MVESSHRRDTNDDQSQQEEPHSLFTQEAHEVEITIASNASPAAMVDHAVSIKVENDDDSTKQAPECSSGSDLEDYLYSDNAAATTAAPRPIHFTDHYTIKVPSSTVRFRGSNVRVYEQRTSQILMEQQWHPIARSSGTRTSNQNEVELQPQDPAYEKQQQQNDHLLFENDTVITVKNMRTISGFGLSFLRGTYTLVCLFFACFLFIFCFQLLLFIFMDAVVEIGATDYQGRSVANFLGTIFSIPLLIYGLASAMTIAGCFVIDAWDGHVYLRQVGNWSLVWTEWISLLVFLGIPVTTWIVTLFANSQSWWQITALTWFCCVWAFYLCFCGTVIFYELDAAVTMLRELEPSTSQRRWTDMARRAILVRQVYQFSAERHLVRMVNHLKKDQAQGKEWTGLYSRLLLCLADRECCFETLNPPFRVYSTDDVLGVQNFVTKNTWSLDKLYCWNYKSQTIAVVRGPSAVQPNQMKSSLVCSITGSLLVILFIIALSLWYKAGVLAFALTMVILLCVCLPRARSTVSVYKMYRDVVNHAQQQNDEKDKGEYANVEEEEDDCIYQVSETYRVARPKKWVCWTLFVLEIAILFVWPLVTLFVVGNYAIAVVFVFISIISAVRYYLNASLLAKELGSFECVGKHPQDDKNAASEEKESYSNIGWKAKSRLSSILRNVTRGQTRTIWMWIFALLAFFIILYAVASLGTSVEDSVSDAEQIVLLNDFSYTEQPDLPYPSCRMGKGLQLPGGNSTALADYAFLAALAYQRSDLVQNSLDTWFGQNVSKNELGIVAIFRSQVEGGAAPVSYQFISFPERFGVVIVRGSTTPWEWLTDAQLWAGAALAGVIREILPIGSIWTPILDTLLQFNSFIQSESLNRVALYTQTTKFVKYLKASGNYTTLHITGQSLGGGISIITGAQTGIPAIAVSGPNAMMSRRTFDPPITEDALNTKVFNIVPARDLVPRVDDLGDLYQRVQCRGPKNDLWSCHNSVRSLCEILFTCGTQNRPALCSCATKFGYPEAIPDGNRTFTEVCGSERNNQ